jgi:hypothetical protein
MYQEKVNSILLVNSYLTYCKMKNPNSPNVKMAQKYLTVKIGQTLQTSRQKSKVFYNFLPFLSFLIR